MKNLSINKIVKYMMFVLIGGVVLASCDRTLNSEFVNEVKSYPNLALFQNTKKSATHIANGTAYDVGIKMKVAGPHMKDVSGDITVTVKPTYEGFTDSLLNKKDYKKAREGVNFKIPDNTITLKESNNYLGIFHFKMLSQGIDAFHLKRTPVVKLLVSKTTGSKSVIASGKPILMKFNYGCNSQMAGTYKVVSSHRLGKYASTYAPPPHKALVIPDPGVGQYHTTSIGGWFTGSPYRPGGYASFNFGLKFTDVCGNITVNATSLGGTGTNPVKPNGTTEVQPKRFGATNGNLDYFILKYTIHFGVGDLPYKAKYVKIGPLPASVKNNGGLKKSVKTPQEMENLPRAKTITNN